MTDIQELITQAAQTMESLRPLEPNIRQAANLVTTCLLNGGKLMACGNGGSAADVSDFTTEYVCRFMGDRQPYPALNMTADGGLLTAVGNDYSFDDVFARQIRAFGRPGDIVLAVSTSGQSKNIIRALEEARSLQLQSVALLGKDGGAAKGLATVDLIVPGKVTARIQEAHKFMFHTICQLVDPSLKR